MSLRFVPWQNFQVLSHIRINELLLEVATKEQEVEQEVEQELSQDIEYPRMNEEQENDDHGEQNEEQDGDAEVGEEESSTKSLSGSTKQTTRLPNAKPATPSFWSDPVEIQGYSLEENEDPAPLVSKKHTNKVASARPAATLTDSILAELDRSSYSFSNNGPGDMYNQNVGNTHITHITNNASEGYIHG